MIETDPNQRPDPRRAVIRSALVWTPIFVTSSALSVTFALIALDDSPGAWISFAITALVALLSGVSALGAMRDLYAVPTNTTGIIERKWRKSDIIVFRGHYILIKKRVFRVPRPIFEAMPEAGTAIVIEHFPHTNALVSWEPATMPTPDSSQDEGPSDPERSDPILPGTAFPSPESSLPGYVPSDPPARVEPPSFGASSRPPVTPPSSVEPPRFGSDPLSDREHRE
jgi:hypothetical protein